MKRILIYIIVLLAVILVPLNRTDVGKLRPVQTVAVYFEGADCVIATDTGDEGRGETAEQALSDLKATTPAIIYLDTAQYLLVGKNSMDAIEALRSYFSGSVELYSFRGDADFTAASKYLSVHGNGPALKCWKNGEKLPVLQCSGAEIKTLKKT